MNPSEVNRFVCASCLCLEIKWDRVRASISSLFRRGSSLINREVLADCNIFISSVSPNWSSLIIWGKCITCLIALDTDSTPCTSSDSLNDCDHNQRLGQHVLIVVRQWAHLSNCEVPRRRISSQKPILNCLRKWMSDRPARRENSQLDPDLSNSLKCTKLAFAALTYGFTRTFWVRSPSSSRELSHVKQRQELIRWGPFCTYATTARRKRISPRVDSGMLIFVGWNGQSAILGYLHTIRMTHRSPIENEELSHLWLYHG